MLLQGFKKFYCCLFDFIGIVSLKVYDFLFIVQSGDILYIVLNPSDHIFFNSLRNTKFLMQP